MRFRPLFLACAAAAAMVVAACGGDGASGPSDVPVQFGAGKKTKDITQSKLLDCAQLPYAVDSARVDRRTEVTLTAGPHKLIIPAGAVRTPTWIKIETASGNHGGVRLSPHGIRFSTPVKLKLDYRNCTDDSYLNEVVWVDEDYNVLEAVPSHDDGSNKFVTAWLSHFSLYVVREVLSKYAVAY